MHGQIGFEDNQERAPNGKRFNFGLRFHSIVDEQDVRMAEIHISIILQVAVQFLPIHRRAYFCSF